MTNTQTDFLADEFLLDYYVGKSPLVRLQRLASHTQATVLAKLEGNNPAGSVKDRPAYNMIVQAEKRGQIKSGDTLIEATSGNTGIALAMVAAMRGYKMKLIMPNNMSQERKDAMLAYGAELIEVTQQQGMEGARDLALQMQAEGKGFVLNQFGNPDNVEAHYLTTGPEIWKQTGGKITHFVVGVGTGGTISGVSKYLKERNPNIKVWGIDTYGSVFKKYHETGIFDENEIYSYITEGIGEDILPKNVDFSLIDGFTKVTDKDAAVYTRRLALEEGIFVGNSAGAAIKGVLQLKEHFKPEDVVVVLFHDSGSRYVGKMFNDDWMRERGFLDEEMTKASDLIKSHIDKPLIIVRTEELVSHAIERLKKYNISQIPVIDSTGFVGSLDETDLFRSYFADKNIGDKPIREIMGKPYPIVKENTPLEEVTKLINKDNQAVLVALENGKYHIITKHDIISSIN